MTKYQELRAARILLELDETADLKSIKTNCHRLLAQWHPDKCTRGLQVCHKKTKQIIAAYNMLTDYCQTYRYSFTETAVKRHLTAEQWWSERFGVDPLWGNRE